MMKAKAVIPVVVVCLLALEGASWAKAAGEEASPAAALFERALRADADGQATLRADLLREALRVDPDFALARWHLGQVSFQGKWRSIVSVGQLVSHDPRWQEYRRRAAVLDDRPEAHAVVARWCRSKGLEREEKWHWVQVLKTDADNREALGSLGLKRYRGGLYTNEQITKLRQQRDQAEKDFKRFRRQFKRLVSLAERGTAEQRAQSLAEIAAVSDPAAVDALMHVVVKVSARESRLKAKLGQVKAKRFIADVSRAVIGALTDMGAHQATLKLVEIAVLAPHAEVRRSGAEALRYRPPTSYMPLLMASLAAPVESSFSIDVAANGLVTLVEEFYEAGPTADIRKVRSSGYSTHSDRGVAAGHIRKGRDIWRVTFPVVEANIQQDIQQAAARSRVAQQQVTAENEARQARNARILEVLEIATGQQLGTDPKAWWTAWQQYNELDDPNETPLYETFEPYDYASPDVYPSRPAITYIGRPGNKPYRIAVSYGSPSCFIAGTPVWTQSGPQPIEQIGVGELVLSQDPITGRLDYRPVIGTTIRPPTGVMNLSLEGETIVATRGHRFWVTGHGWRMAKFLSAGDALYGGKGSVDLHTVALGENAPAYNLIVGEYHTYFVGHSRLLVHDNNCPLPTTATVPGAQSPGTE